MTGEATRSRIPRLGALSFEIVRDNELRPRIQRAKELDMDINATESLGKANSDLAALKKNPGGVIKEMLNTPGRPLAITVIAVLAAIGAVEWIFGAIRGLGAGLILWPIVFIVLGLASAATALGFCAMRKWAMLLYAALVALFLILSLVSGGGFPIVGLILPAIVLAVAFKFQSKMT
jgi:hypothetical protein